jgi:hypothetical protein
MNHDQINYGYTNYIYIYGLSNYDYIEINFGSSTYEKLF